MGATGHGIRLEGPGANTNNKLIGNTITNSGAEGICILPHVHRPPGFGCAGTPGTRERDLQQPQSPQRHQRPRSWDPAVRHPPPVAASKTTIKDNVTNDNVTFGVAIDASGAANPGPPTNKVTGNKGKGNGQFDGFPGTPRIAGATPRRATTA